VTTFAPFSRRMVAAECAKEPTPRMRMLGWEDFAGNRFALFEIGMIESCGRDDSDSDFECKA
jgi:hypothetical protein